MAERLKAAVLKTVVANPHRGFESHPLLQLKDHAKVVELVDTPDSKSGAPWGVRVRVPPLAPNYAPVAHLAEHLSRKQEAVGSSPTRSFLTTSLIRYLGV